MAKASWTAGVLAVAAALHAAPASAYPGALDRPVLMLRRDAAAPPSAPTATATLWLPSPATATPGLVWWLGPGAESLVLRIKVRVYPFYGAQEMGVRADWTF